MKDSITRIIGVVLLVVSMLAHKYIGVSVALLVIAGLIMLISDKKNAKKQLIIFKKSFKELKHKRYYLIALYDILCLGVFFLIAPLFSAWFVAKMNTLTASNIFSLLFLLLVYLFAVTLLLIIAYSVFKGLIWLQIMKKKVSAGFLKRFFLLNLCWWLILLIPIIIFVLGAKQEYLFYCVILFAILYVHFTSILHYVFTNNLRIGKAVKQAFAITFIDIKQFLLPYSYIILVYFILLQIFWIVPKTANIMLFASILFIVFFLAWYRLYLAEILKQIRT